MVNERLENGVLMIRLNMWAVETNMKPQWGSEFHYHSGNSLEMLDSPTSRPSQTQILLTVDLGFFLVWTKENSIKYKNNNNYNRKESIEKGAELHPLLVAKKIE